VCCAGLFLFFLHGVFGFGLCACLLRENLCVFRWRSWLCVSSFVFWVCCLCLDGVADFWLRCFFVFGWCFSCLGGDAWRLGRVLS